MKTRRRFLTIAAAAIALPSAGSATGLHTWQGTALGARATIRLDHPEARAITARVAAEIDRLEDIFSLYRPDSALSRLNAASGLALPPFELLECLSIADAAHEVTEGRFDPTIQNLWKSHADAGASDIPLGSDVLAELASRTGWDKVRFDADAITLRPGMALTLNGIAQGYIADRVAAMLVAEGLDRILIDTGEFRALGGRPEGGGWPVRLAAGGSVSLSDRALATSAPLGTTFDREGRLSHIVDPHSGHPSETGLKEITVTGPSAAMADAFTTAACLMPSRDAIERCLAGLPELKLQSAKFA